MSKHTSLCVLVCVALISQTYLSNYMCLSVYLHIYQLEVSSTKQLQDIFEIATARISNPHLSAKCQCENLLYSYLLKI